MKVGPSIGEHIEDSRRVIARTLRRSRQRGERGTEPEPWAAVELPAGLMLADVCNAPGLSRENPQRGVLGEVGTAFLEAVQDIRISV